MARIRTIKPELWESHELGSLSPLARLTFIGLISLSDDEGRGRASTELLWGRLHSYASASTKARFRRALGELKSKDADGVPLVIFYKHGDAAYYWVPKFNAHQRIDKPNDSKIPPYPDSHNVTGLIPDRSRGGKDRSQGEQGQEQGREGIKERTTEQEVDHGSEGIGGLSIFSQNLRVLLSVGVAENNAHHLADNFGSDRIKDVIDASKKSKTRNTGGWIYNALVNQWDVGNKGQK